MARSGQGNRARVNKLKARIVSNTRNHFAVCTIPFCGRPTQRAAKSGLAIALCRGHLLHRQRHGSPWCSSPRASALKPYACAAVSFINHHRKDLYVHAAITGLRNLLQQAGPAIIVTRLRGLPPNRRAAAALARLREAKIEPERLLAIAMAVHALIQEAPQVCHRITEWRIVAIAKAAHRLASGYHRVWEMPNANGQTQRIELHAYPRSSGRVLRYLGQMIEKECELVIEHHLRAALALKVIRYGPHPAVADPLKFAAAAHTTTGG